MRRHPNWTFAEAVLARVIPGATGFDLDRIPGLDAERWERFEIDGHVDDVTLGFLEYCLPRVAGPLIVVTTGSRTTAIGPFFVDGERLVEFATAYCDVIGPPLVDGDTVVVSPATGRVIVVHHNGLIDTLQGVEQPGW